MIYQRKHSLHTRDRDIANMPIAKEYKSEPWYVSLLLWLGIIAFVACVYIIAQAYVNAQALAHAV
jgi:hypothetical protein